MILSPPLPVSGDQALILAWLDLLTRPTARFTLRGKAQLYWTLNENLHVNLSPGKTTCRKPNKICGHEYMYKHLKIALKSTEHIFGGGGGEEERILLK